jgi:hypothetical protein
MDETCVVCGAPSETEKNTETDVKNAHCRKCRKLEMEMDWRWTGDGLEFFLLKKYLKNNTL